LGANVLLSVCNKRRKTVGEIFKTLISLFMEALMPYRAKFENLIGRKVDSIELFPASEVLPIKTLKEGMLLLLNAVFYEFVKSDDFSLINPDVYH
jgi:hypothetical protein